LSLNDHLVTNSSARKDRTVALLVAIGMVLCAAAFIGFRMYRSGAAAADAATTAATTAVAPTPQEALHAGLLTPAEIGAGWGAMTDSGNSGNATTAGCPVMSDGPGSPRPRAGQIEAEQESDVASSLPLFIELVVREPAKAASRDWKQLSTGLPKCTHLVMADGHTRLTLKMSRIKFAAASSKAAASELTGVGKAAVLTGFVAVIRVDRATLVACIYINPANDRQRQPALALFRRAAQKMQHTTR
jgi:hypothetical protein